MKAVLCKEFGPVERLVLEDVPSPVAGKGQVVIKVAAAGVNFPDTLLVQGKYQLRPPFPFSPGGEFAGTVMAAGEGVAHVRAGDMVVGMAAYGGFAEEVLVDAASVIPLPAGIEPAVAAALMVAHGTALHALQDRAQIKAGETLLVLGAAGGVGLAAVEIGKLLGARVIAAASTDDKLDVCRSHGADMAINYAGEDLKERVRALTEGRGVDVVFDPVGGRYSEPALRSVAWKGRFLVIGFAAGEIPQIPLNLPLLKGSSIVGVFWGDSVRREPAQNRANIARLLDWVATGKLAPLVSARYPLSGAVDALKSLQRREVTGKIVIVP
jgi:NADPH2:quinone reductase